MPKIKISPDQQTVTSEHGTFSFFEKRDGQRCKKCWFERSTMEICYQIPCCEFEREDAKKGYFSKHEMP